MSHREGFTATVSDTQPREASSIALSQALIDKVCDSSTDNAQLAQKLYDVLVLILETLPDTADILQRLLLALQRELQAGATSLILAQLVLNLMQLPAIRKVCHFCCYLYMSMCDV